jgi:hypothetical protein
MHPLLLLLLATPSNDLVERVREATHVADSPSVSVFNLQGQARYLGVDEGYSLRFNTDGRFVADVSGPIPHAAGFDGKRYWAHDRSGAPQPLDLEELDRTEGLMLLATGEWLEPHSPVELKARGTSIELRWKKSQLRELIDIDPQSWLPKSASFETSSGPVQIKLADWRSVGPRKLPFHIEVEEAGLSDTYGLDKGDAAGSDDASDYEPGEWAARDTRFDPAIPPEIECQRAITGHLLVHPKLNGKDVGWFILDSGADVMAIDRKVADSLGLAKLGRLPLTGVGGNDQESFRPIRTFDLGPVDITGLNFSEFDLGALASAFGVKIAGVVGFDLFRRSVVSVKMAQSKVSLYDPATYRLPSGAWTGMRFDGGNMAVNATLEGGRKGLFRLDTGADGSVAFHSWYVAQEGLLRRKTTSVKLGGVGGTSDAKMGTIDWFELGGHRFEHPRVIFSLATTGAFTDRYLAGNIGQDLLLPFDTVFDAASERVAFLPIP